MSVAKMNAVRTHFLNHLVPYSIVPMATANGMLVMGSNKLSGKGGDCSFPLPEYLIVTGSVSIALVAAGVLGRFLLNLALSNGSISKKEDLVLKIWQVFSAIIGCLQVTALLAGLFVVLPNLPKWQHEHRELDHYCDLQLMLFSIIFLSVVWSLLLITLFSSLFIVFIGNQDEDDDSNGELDQFEHQDVELTAAPK